MASTTFNQNFVLVRTNCGGLCFTRLTHPAVRRGFWPRKRSTTFPAVVVGFGAFFLRTKCLSLTLTLRRQDLGCLA